MVDTTDLKSVDLIGREGSSPSTPRFKINEIHLIILKLKFFFVEFSYNIYTSVVLLKSDIKDYVSHGKSL